MNQSLSSLAMQLMASPKGLLAADESDKTCSKRFDALKIISTKESRRQWRQLLCMSPNVGLYISGVILFDETIRQKTDSGQSFAEALMKQGMLPGIKVDKGLVEMDNFAPQTITEGLDGLSERLQEYYQMGARFTKWRSAFTIGSDLPSPAVVRANLVVMARYASIVQSAKMVPIVEPELIYGGEHSIDESARATESVLKILFEELKALRVDLSGLILKTSMVLAGTETTISKPKEVAEFTLRVLHAAVPREVAGIVFLSGGQTPQQATKNLNAIGVAGSQPWPITYSYSRAVQDPVLKLWRGKNINTKKAQIKFAQLLAQNSAARGGEFAE
ncbi:fructose-bisphosphate aldolase class I [Candidatus Saccharibacteria bacterium]|nr:fructose-bisphosphate aldolase class I [Candidatus Saccharibacteria bacterium]